MGNYDFLISQFVTLLISILLVGVCGDSTEYPGLIKTKLKEGGTGNQWKDNGEFQLIKGEVQSLNKEFTKSAILQTSRRKRSYSQYTYDVKLDQHNNFFEVKLASPHVYPFICNGKPFLIQPDGIYRLDGLSPSTENFTTPKLNRVSQWSLNPGDKVLHVKEWEQKCFVLISNENGTFSSIYTLHGEQMTPVFRQQIRNYGISSDAEFFTLKRNLYLIITNDNSVHSLTICPLFRWAGTYMDEIHAIQTRGAVAVETFTINSWKYIAIAQSQDAAGNFEVGTQVLRMDSKEELEKVQLLWSFNPVALQYVQILQEHYLVIGLAKESSICYWFGGIDFIQWQSLEGYAGQPLFMDEWILPDKEPILLAAKNSSVKFYARSITSTYLTLNSNVSALNVNPPGEILFAKFLKPSASEVYVTIIQNRTRHISLKIYSAVLIRREIAESQIKETESQLSQCLVDVRKKLDDEGNRVNSLDKLKTAILTTDRDLTFNGSIFTTNTVVLNSEKLFIQSIDVRPANFTDDEIEHESPSTLLKSLEREAQKLTILVISQLDNVLMKSKTGNITGDYKFTGNVEIKTYVGHNSNLQLTTLNNISWDDLDEFALRKTSDNSQHITGKWTIDKLFASSVQLPSNISGINITDFLLKQCTELKSQIQIISGHLIFNDNVDLDQGVLIPPDGVINGISFSDIIWKNGPTTEIRGFKHAANMIGGTNFNFTLINDENFQEWFKSVMHLNGPDQNPTGVKTFVSKKGTRFDNINVDQVNGRIWDEFVSNVLVNGGNQTIEGDIQTDKLVVESLFTEKIGNVRFEELMTTNGDQIVNSFLKISSLSAQKDLNTSLVNGIPLASLAVNKNKEISITSEVKLENFKVNGSITIAEFATIAGKDISELGKVQQKHIYFTTRANKIYLRAPVEASNLITNFTNDFFWEDLENKFWSKSIDNIVQGPLDFRGRKVHIKDKFTTGTLNSISLENDVVWTDMPDSIPIPLNFVGDVFTHGEVNQADGKTIGGFDISEVSLGVVKTNEDQIIRGKKHFNGNLIASGGADIFNLSGIDPAKDVIFLESPDTQFVTTLKRFKKNVFMKILNSEGEIKVGGKINGQDLVKVFQTTAFRGDPVVIPGNLQFNSSFFASSLFVTNKLNGVNVSDLLENALYLNQPQTIKFPILVRNGSVTVKGSSNVTSINGINLKDYFPRVVFKTPPDSRINGTKTFLSLSVEQDLNCPIFNGISLANLSRNAFSRTKAQEVSGTIHFDSLVVQQDLNTSKIAGVDVNDLVYIHDASTCTLHTNVRFVNDTILDAPLLVNGLLNGFPIENVTEGVEDGLFDRQFKNVEVKGNLEWETDSNNSDGLGHLFKNAVTRDTPQEITGRVKFSEGFDAQILDSNPWINNVNLLEIEEDAVQLDEENTIFTGRNQFLHKLVISEPPVNIELLDVDKVNGVDLKNLIKNAVRDSSNGTIYGVKTFTDGLRPQNLTFDDLMGKGDFKWLVTTSDNRTVSHAEFWNVIIENNLNFTHSKNFNLKELIKTRVTLNGDQILFGNYTIPSLNVENECHLTSINGIPVSDIFNITLNEKQTIDGNKTLAGGLIVHGQIDVPNVDGYNFAALHSDVYRRTENEKINRPVIFVQPVLVNQSVKVDKHINDYRIEDLSARFSNALDGVISRASLTHQPKIQNLEKIKDLRSVVTERPFWLEYLRLKQNLKSIGPRRRVEHTLTDRGVIIGFHEQSDGSETALPKGCYCNSVRFLRVGDSSSTAVSEKNIKCSSAFVVTSPLGNIYSVFDQTVSYNQTCSREESAEFIISKGSEVATEDPISELILKESSKGYLTDVKAFSENGIDYLVVSYFFNATNRNHDTGTFVYAVNNGRLNVIQIIPTSGAKRLALSNIEKEWLLAVANNRDSHTNSCVTNSAIYRWSTSSQKFILLREVTTNGAVDVVFITAKDKGVNYEGDSLSLVAFAQNGNTGDGNVVIFQYNKEKKNYYLLETLRTKWSVVALDFLCIQENCYLLVVIPQEGIHFYEYRYVEGFQRTLTVPVADAHDIGPFEWQKRIFFGIASTKVSILAEGVVAGNPIIN